MLNQPNMICNSTMLFLLSTLVIPKWKCYTLAAATLDCLHTFTKFLLARNQATCASFLGAILLLNIIWKPLITLKDSLYHTGSTFGVYIMVFSILDFASYSQDRSSVPLLPPRFYSKINFWKNESVCCCRNWYIIAFLHM